MASHFIKEPLHQGFFPGGGSLPLRGYGLGPKAPRAYAATPSATLHSEVNQRTSELRSTPHLQDGCGACGERADAFPPKTPRPKPPALQPPVPPTPARHELPTNASGDGAV